MRQFFVLSLIAALASGIGPSSAGAQDDEQGPPKLNSGLLSGLKLRNIGPAFMSGRIGDIAVDPVRPSTWYVAAASGGVWKTDNAGTTWKPIFDGEGSYSIGALAVDPNDRFVVWVGTGENNSQRSVGYGDGLYKTVDGGASFTKVGLEQSEHIAKILIDPRNSDVVYVAAQGPLWASGGERGLYKTEDGGKTWARILHVDDNTGVTDVLFDPYDPDVLYAASYQRRRHVWTLINGGPGSAIHKSTDAGKTWKKITRGLPSVELGRIGLAISFQNADVLYAIVEAADGQSGFFRSANGGEQWTKQGDYVSGSPQYYQEIYADPHQFDRIYSMDTYAMVSDDGGKTFTRLGEEWKHVDNHALVIDPGDADHLLIGSDGGLYESFDRGKSWKYVPNLPLAQFYKLAVDDATPFYNVYGGTQDNATQGGPSRTTNVHGIRNSDWFVTVFGDGFDPAVEPGNPDIVYSQWQYGGLIRYDRASGEQIDIRPQPEPDGPPLRWNWDSALLISPHSPTRVYFAAQILFRSDDRGDTWRAVSPDLTRNMDRNQLPVMGRVWGVDAVAKNNSTSFYGTIVALTESPLVEGLLYAGTDDGLIQVTEDGGGAWRKVEKLEGVPERTYVNDLEASRHDPNTVYAVLNNHKNGDFKPYVVRSTDRGRSWTSIAGDLPARGSAYTIVEDHVRPDLLFVGTEFGLFVTLNGGVNWIELTGDMPTIAVRELEVQRRENDLAVASFGRGFYILDNYAPLRDLSVDLLQRPAHIFPVKTALLYVQDAPMAGEGKAFQGAQFYTAPNPDFGATFTYYLKEPLRTRKAQRQKAEAAQAKRGENVMYPPWEDLRAEDREEAPAVFLVVRDEEGNVVSRVKGSTSSGLHRATWNLRIGGFGGGWSGDAGPLAMPGRYTVALASLVDGEVTELVAPVPFDVEPLGLGSLPAQDRAAVLAFQRQTGALQRAVVGTNRAAGEAAARLKAIKETVAATPHLDPALYAEARALELRLTDLRERLTGDPTRARRNEPAMPGILDRIQEIVGGHWATTYGPTQTHRRLYDIAATEFEGVLEQFRTLIEQDLPALERRLEEAGAPWTTGRGVPRWRRQ
jgi:photosystem II stability/assembly factor-like uncharacterized protein